MCNYTHILVGLDLSSDCKTVLEKSHALAESFSAKLSVAHIVEPLAFAYGGDVPIDLTEAQSLMEQQANKRLAQIVEETAAKPVEQIVCIGQAAHELHRIAEGHGMDLIVVGSHGRHGLALLFGSITKGVVQGAKCDVLAMKL